MNNGWFVWAPNIHWPYGGTLTQTVQPNTNWFFGAIKPTAGDGALEQKIVDIASYGRQIGLLTEVVIALSEQIKLANPQANVSVDRLKDIAKRVEELKADYQSEPESAVTAIMKTLGEKYPKKFKEVQELVARMEVPSVPVLSKPRKS